MNYKEDTKLIDEINLEPLYCEPLYDDESQYWTASFSERICLIIPIIGWLIFPHFRLSRIYPVIEIIENQLIEREDKKLSDFYELHNEKQIAEKLSKSIEENIGWCNDRYMPCDPVKILLWSYADALDVTFVLKDIEDMIDRRLTELEAENIMEVGTIDDIIKLIVAEKQKNC